MPAMPPAGAPLAAAPPAQPAGSAAFPGLRELAPVAEGLFGWHEDGPYLLGSRCEDCATLAFPRQASCPRCGSARVQPAALPSAGTLWSWTVQGFAPKSPPYAGRDAGDAFVPFAVGYVELPGGIAVEGRLTGAPSPPDYQIGMAMALVIEPFERADGSTVATYAFAPARKAGP